MSRTGSHASRDLCHPTKEVNRCLIAALQHLTLFKPPTGVRGDLHMGNIRMEP